MPSRPFHLPFVHSRKANSQTMKTWVRKSLKVGILSAGFLLVGGAAAAQAASSSDNFGIGSGNQVQADVAAPVSVSGNAIALLGGASAHGSGGATASASASAAGAGTTTHNFGILGGNQAGLSALLPVSLTGNAVGVGGTAQASGGAGASASVTPHATAGGSTSGNFGIVGGNQVAPMLSIPIDVSGNSIGLLGTAQATSHTGGASAMVTPSLAGSTSDNFGVGSGNQVAPVISIPIDICGNSIGLFGGASASCGGGTGSGSGNGGGYGTGTGTGGYGTGTGSGTGGSTGGGYTTGGGTGSGGYTTGGGAGGYATGTGAGASGGTAAGASLATMSATKHAHHNRGLHLGRRHHAAAARSAHANDESALTRQHQTGLRAGVSGGTSTSSNFGILGGNQLGALISIPISVSNNALGLLGQAGA
ncbi:MAG: DUF320 domain-containing protein [Actinobacteria bacterium]|nr:MAG: DUF320 domain-containing protein [Actinomycetota bacterium]